MATRNGIRWNLAGLLAAMLLPAGARASTPGEATPQAAPSTRQSPYARYAREHAQSVEKKPTRVKPTPSMNRHAPRGSAQSGRH